jgi:hypothetical protein
LERQTEFREWLLIIHEAHRRHTKRDVWICEATFKENGKVNKNKCVYWHDKIPHQMMEEGHIVPGVTDCAGMWAENVIVPLVL